MNTQNLLEKILRFGLYLVSLTVFVVIPGTFFPFVFARTMIFQILVEVLGAIWLYLSVKERKELKRGVIFYSVSAFWFVNFLATIFSANAHVSFWGKAMRMDGFLFFSHLLIWFLILIFEFKEEKGWLKFWKTFAVLSGIVSLAALTQYFVNIWPGLIYRSGRVFSFLGNSAFLANYLVFAVFLSLFLILRSAARRSRLFWFAILALNLSAFYLSKTRGAMIGILAGFVVLAAVLLFFEHRRKIIKIISFVIFGLVVMSVIFIAFAPRFIDPASHPVIGRFVDFGRESFMTRLVGADIAWKGIIERPILGWGSGNYDLIFDKFYNPASLRMSFAETVWDKPHNYFLEMGTSAGILGILSYLGLYAAAIFCVLRAKRSGVLRADGAGIFLGLLAAKFIAVLSSFETIDSLIILFAFLAYLNFLGAEAVKKYFVKIPALLVVAFVLCFGYFGVLNIKNIFGSRAIAAANAALGIDKIVWRENVLKLLGEKTPYKDDMMNAAVIDLAAWEAKGASVDEMLAPTLAPLAGYLADAENRNPRAYIYPFELAQVLGMRGEYLLDRDAYGRALLALDRASKISPKRQSIYLVKGKILLSLWETDEAIATLRSAVNLYPEAREPHWFLGLALAENGARKEGILELEAGSDVSSLKVNEAFYLISLYSEEKMYEKIVPIYEHLIALDPQNAAEWWARLAATYLELKNKDKASEAASEALTLDPSLRAGIGEFMKKLEKLP
jgi:tetratricopeptide (TPR) repeat protein/O-antigen ligase